MTDTSDKEKDIMSFFPLPKPRKAQEVVIKEIDNAFKAGKRYVILEGPVGCGKSAIALTHALSTGPDGAHIITPTKALQDQYFEDFEKHIVTMKGRSAYPCTRDSTPTRRKAVLKDVKNGRVKPPVYFDSCAVAPCLEGGEAGASVLSICKGLGGCPYVTAMEVAQLSPVVVHNMHSFLFQTGYGQKFEIRKKMIIDEAHEIEDIVRDFSTVNFTIPKYIPPSYPDRPTDSELIKWQDFLSKPEFVPPLTERDKLLAKEKKDYVSPNAAYLEKVAYITSDKGLFSKGMSVEVEYLPPKPGLKDPAGTTFKFIPHYVGGIVKEQLLAFGETCLLMSGTIYDRDMFCRSLGIPSEEAYFIRIPSSFPKEYRPIYAKAQYQVDTSHANWDESFPEMIEKIKNIMSIFHDVKGLIHAPSYFAANQIMSAITDPRLVTHGPHDTIEKLEQFMKAPGNGVFVSPVCQQGVDFKDDRARFQIILRVPYPSIGGEFVKDMAKKNFSWYNLQALKVWGQQIGRINRSAGDYGATFLVDSRFNKFIQKNSKLIPDWVKQAIVYR